MTDWLLSRITSRESVCSRMRKEATVVIEAEGRDKGKVFRLRELSAEAAESWGLRLMLALSKSGVEVPEGFLEMGMVGVAAMGLKAMGGLPWEVAKPLLDEMMWCIQIQPGSRQEIVRELISDDIEEVSTRIRLREEVLTLHTGFSVREFLSNLRRAREEAAIRAAQIVTGDDTEISQQESGE